MTHLELNDVEEKALGEVFESYLSDLRMEIASTDRAEFREGLREKREILEAVMERMRAGHA